MFATRLGGPKERAKLPDYCGDNNPETGVELTCNALSANLVSLCFMFLGWPEIGDASLGSLRIFMPRFRHRATKRSIN